MLNFISVHLNDIKKMDTLTTILFISSVIVATLLFKWLVSWIMTHSKNTADNFNHPQIIKQLSENTKIIKEIELKLAQDSWIKQQIWIKKQEIYENIFKILSDIDRYINYEKIELDYYYWFEIGIYQQYSNNNFDEHSYEQSMKEKDDYYKKKSSEQYKIFEKSMLDIKNNSIEGLKNILYLKSLFLSNESQIIIKNIIKDINIKPTDSEEWENYVNDISNSFSDYKEKLLLSATNELSLSV